MSPTLIAASSQVSAPKASFRRPVAGPEAHLVDAFIEQVPFRLQPGFAHALFREPRVERAAPDLLYVAWNPSVVRQWPAARRRLRRGHFRLLQFLRTAEASERRLILKGGVEKQRALADLEAAGLLYVEAGIVRLEPLRKVFAATRIVAIEAKVAEWRRVLEQAHVNTWFASESNVLVPRAPRELSYLHRARELGIGAWALQERLVRLTPARRLGLPVSLGSWQINDWLLDL